MSWPDIDLLVAQGTIVTQNDDREVIEDGAVAVRGDRIVGIGPTAELMAQYAAAETLDVQGRAVFPGLINTHIHLFQTGVKGLGEDMPVQDWVEVVTAPTAIHISPEEMYLFCLTGCLVLCEGMLPPVSRSDFPSFFGVLNGDRTRKQPAQGKGHALEYLDEKDLLDKLSDSHL